MSTTLETTFNEGVATITFGTDKSNSLPGALLRNLAAAIDAQGKNAECRTVVLRTVGEGAFCAGASFDELLQVRDLDSAKTFFEGFAVVLLAMRRAPQPVIVRVQGKAVGGGVGIAAAADYTLATEASSIRLSELAIGIGPFVIGPAVERKIGLAAFNELALEADWRDARWAERRGLYQKVVATVTELDVAVTALARKLAAYSPEAATRLKSVLWHSTEHWEELLRERAAESGRLVLTPFAQNAIGSIKQRT